MKRREFITLLRLPTGFQPTLEDETQVIDSTGVLDALSL
jgi:hypothetical protein